MTATIHKITAGDGYTYLTKTVASGDVDRGQTPLGVYYTERGEAPGTWYGKGLQGLELDHLKLTNRARAGKVVTEAQMLALFGEMRHPEADLIERAAILRGERVDTVRGRAKILASSKLGKAYMESTKPTSRYLEQLDQRYKAWRESAGVAEIPKDVRERIITEVALECFKTELSRHPSPGELTAYIVRESRPKPQPIAGYDVTFSAPKSVSILWALGDQTTTETITRLHTQAVTDALDWVEEQFLYTRQGAGGVRQVDVKGMIAAVFMHRDSRAGDPDLHTHCAIANTVQTADGKWLTIDGREIYKHLVVVSEFYNLRLQNLIETEMGISFTALERADGRRPVYEIAGVPPELISAMSSRRAAITNKLSELEADFLTRNGRLPTAPERSRLAQTATLETRPDKKEPRSFAEQQAAWRAHTERVMGVDGVRNVFRAVAQYERADDKTVDIDALTEKIIERVSDARATFGVSHLRAEALRVVREPGIPVGERDVIVAQIMSTITDQLVTFGRKTPPPIGLCRADGTSVYVRAHSDLFSTHETLAREALIVDAAGHRDGRKLSDAIVDAAITNFNTQSSFHLGLDQENLVRELATSGARIQLALAPAGAGKTTAMRVLADAWRTTGGSLIGLSHQAFAAQNLGEAIGDAPTDTLAALTFQLAKGSDALLPAWADTVDHTTLIIVDEAGMASTKDLAMLTNWAITRGASLRFVGDDRQLASISAGGVLRDIKAQHGVVGLSELNRFASPAEGEATLGMREGDKSSLGFYADNNRIHVETTNTVHQIVFDAWVGDVTNGLETVMLAASLEDVNALNVAAQAHRIKHGLVDTSRFVELADGNLAAIGDVIVTRLNKRSLKVSATDHVKNRDRWIVRDVTEHGLVVQHQQSNRVLTLPPEYFQEHVELGYSTTINGAQGMTVDSCHTIIHGNETRNQLYVGTSRGRLANHIYVADTSLDALSELLDRIALNTTAIELLENILDTDEDVRSATTELRNQSDPWVAVSNNVNMYQDATEQAYLLTLGEDTLVEIRAGADALSTKYGAAHGMTGALTEHEAWPALQLRLAMLTVHGINPLEALETAIASREFHDSRDDAAILWYRLDHMVAKLGSRDSSEPRMMRWLHPLPEPFTDRLNPPSWVAWLAEQRTEIRDQINQLGSVVETWTQDSAPRWAVPMLALPVDLLTDVAVWRTMTGMRDNDMNPIGNKPGNLVSNAKREAYESLDDRLARACQVERWFGSFSPQVMADPGWKLLALRLNQLVDGRYASEEQVKTWLGELEISKPSETLPIEHTADAAWYRLLAHMTSTQAVFPTMPAPAWFTQLKNLVGVRAAGKIITDPSWPALQRAIKTHPLDQIPGVLEAAVKTARTLTPPPTRSELASVLTRLINEINTLDDKEHLIGDIAPEDIDQLPERVIEYDDSELPERPPLFTNPEDSTDTTTRTKPARILELNKQAAEFFQQHYQLTPGARAYLTERFGQDPATDPRFTIGYAPAGWTNLVEHLTETGATSDELIDAGLAKINTKGNLMDMFRDRIIIAMTDGEDILGFSGRARPGTESPQNPKYVNTPTTEVFVKGAYLYGADLLGPDVLPVRVEGPMDAIAVTLAGDGEAVGVSPGGTSLTRNQVMQMIQHTTMILTATDTDLAGQKAAARDFTEIYRERLIDARVLPIIGKDPADMALTNPETLRNYLAHPQFLTQLPIRIVHNQIDQLATRNEDAGRAPTLDPVQRRRIHEYAKDLIAPLAPAQRREISETVAHIILDASHEAGVVDDEWRTEYVNGFITDVDQHAAGHYLPSEDTRNNSTPATATPTVEQPEPIIEQPQPSHGRPAPPFHSGNEYANWIAQQPTYDNNPDMGIGF